MKLRGRFAAAALAALSFLAPVHAQLPLCCGDDNLQGPCWQRTQINLPAFPDIGHAACGICWTACQPSKVPIVVRLNAPVPQQCGVFTSTVSVSTPAGLPLMSGTVRMDYTRTWNEIDAGPLVQRQLQVWRFLIKVDMKLDVPAGGIGTGCPIPRCLTAPGAHPTSFWHGYVDYAKDCQQNTFESAMALFHGCDAFQHLPVVSATPGVFHPNTSYAIVAPDTPGMPFFPAGSTGSFAPPPDGSTAGGIRLVPTPAPDPRCFTEEQKGGNIQNLVSVCLCPLTLGGQYTLRATQGGGMCGSLYNCVNVSDIAGGIYWLWEVTADIGTWAPPSGMGFPGREHLWMNEVFHRFHDGCTGVTHADMFYGVTTDNGLFVVPDPSRPWQDSQAFEDLASNWSTANPLGPTPFPLLGTVFRTRHLMYENIF